MKNSSSDTKIYFCNGCGDCCRWSGHVHVNEKEITAIAGYLNMPESEFIDQYTEITQNRKGLSIIDNEKGHCYFFDDEANACGVYPVRPKQCKTFPNDWTVKDLESICPALPLKYKLKRLNS